MATIQIEGHLRREKDFGGLRLDDVALPWHLHDLDDDERPRRFWSGEIDYGRVRITIEQLGTPEDEALDILEEHNG